jgi:alkanesulfonate monooxygenase SsuD/methylene tetrahydromethanopterin reductase-like flavin-dependent oxidoreductase (luciferase family)
MTITRDTGPSSAPRGIAHGRREVRFGVSLPTSGPFATSDHIFAVAAKAEELGYDDVWVNDFFNIGPERLGRSPVGAVEAVRDQLPNFFEGLSTLASVGGRLQRIGLAQHGLVLSQRDVRIFAKQICTIHELVGRRLTVAPAIGGHDLETFGIPKAERGRRLDDALDALTTILALEHPVSFVGRYTRFADATFYPRPQDIRLWITGDSEPALHRVVKYATGWFSSVALIERFRENLSKLEELANAAGRDPLEIARATDIFVCLADTTAEAEQMSRATLVDRYGSFEEGRHHAAVGDADAVAEHVMERMRLGLTCIEFRFICHSPEAHIEMVARLAADVLPRARAASPLISVGA